MKIRTREHRGPHMALTRGTWVHPKTTTDAIYIMYLKQKDTGYQGQRNCSHSTAENQLTHQIRTLRNSQPSSRRTWPRSDGKRAQSMSSNCSRHLEAYLTGAPPPAPEQRVHEWLEQRVTEASIPAMTPLPEIQRVSDAPHTMVANNPRQRGSCKIKHALTNGIRYCCSAGSLFCYLFCEVWLFSARQNTERII
jgi:hypothetical protein